MNPNRRAPRLLWILAIGGIACNLLIGYFVFWTTPRGTPARVEVIADTPKLSSREAKRAQPRKFDTVKQVYPSEAELATDKKILILVQYDDFFGGDTVLRIQANGFCTSTVNLDRPKRRTWRLGDEKLNELIALVRSSGYFDLRSGYVNRNISDGIRITLMVRGASFKKQVVCVNEFPKPFKRLLDWVDANVYQSLDAQEEESCQPDKADELYSD